MGCLEWTYQSWSDHKIWLQMNGWPVVNLVTCSCSWSTRLTNRQHANDPAFSASFRLCPQERYGCGTVRRLPSTMMISERIKAAIRITPHICIYKRPFSLMPTLEAPHLKLVCTHWSHVCNIISSSCLGPRRLCIWCCL